MNIHGTRPDRATVETHVRSRIAASGLRHRYAATDLARAELKPIVHISTPCHSRHNRPYGVREWGVFLDGKCIAYVDTTRAGKLRLWPYAVSEQNYQIEEEVP